MKFQLEQAIEILRQTPLTVKSLLGNLSEDWTATEGNLSDWSPFDVVGHFIHCEESDWIPRAEIILAQGENRTFEPFDRYAQFEKSKGKNLKQLLEEFAKRRNASIEKLISWNLSDDRLQLKGIHPEFGEVTLEELLSTWAVHDLTHIRQITIFLAKKYDKNVGKWKQYLSILQ